MQRPIFVGIVISLSKRRPVDQGQRWMKRGSILEDKSVCHMLRRESWKRRREHVRRRGPLMRIWRLEDAPTLLLHSGTYPGQILWSCGPSPFGLTLFVLYKFLSSIPWKLCGLRSWKMRHVVEIRRLRAWKMCWIVVFVKRVRGREIMDRTSSFPRFQDRAKVIDL